MNADVLYAVLMSFGWLFLLGWLALLLIACRLAFRSEDSSGHSSSAHGFAGGARKTAGATGRFNIHLRG
jgi:hypothetical protein